MLARAFAPRASVVAQGLAGVQPKAKRATLRGLALLLLASQALACKPHESPAKAQESRKAEATPAARPGPFPAKAPLYERDRKLMGTIFRIAVASAPASRCQKPVDEAFEEIARLETLLSEWLPSSDISRINAAAGKAPVRVGPEAIAVVKKGLEISKLSQGAFDLSWAALRQVYLFEPGKTQAPDPEFIRQRLALVRWQDVKVDEKKQRVFLKRRGMAIGTGGIAKGYALDRAAEMLDAAGLEQYMLFAGGQVQVRGMRGDRPWRVGIQHPRKNDYFAFFEATSGSISTSGDYEHSFVDDKGKHWHHIIDPRTGLPVEKMASVTLITKRGIDADALSTASFVLGPQKAMAMLAKEGSAEAVLVDTDLRVHITPGTEKRLIFTKALQAGDRLPP